MSNPHCDLHEKAGQRRGSGTYSKAIREMPFRGLKACQTDVNDWQEVLQSMFRPIDQGFSLGQQIGLLTNRLR